MRRSKHADGNETKKAGDVVNEPENTVDFSEILSKLGFQMVNLQKVVTNLVIDSNSTSEK